MAKKQRKPGVCELRDADLVIGAVQRFAKELDTSIRECTALVCSIVISSGIPGLDTPEKVVKASALVHKEIIRELRKGNVH